RLGWKKTKEKTEYSRWELIRMAAEELGPTFIKLAQALSNRPDILPNALIVELQKLQSDVAPEPFEKIEEIIRLEIGGKIESTFKEFKKKPIGSASIGQVHKAKLHDGRDVVVKVQRPGVRRKVETDLDILKTLAKWSESQLERQGIFGAKDILDAFEKSLMKELDYNTEARFMEQFRSYYKKNKKFHIPDVYREYSTGRILVQEFIAGAKITDRDQMIAWGLDTKKIAEKGIDIYLSQIFEHGYFHADPHPGNIIIQEDGRLCLIDFGMVGKLTKHDRFAFSGILIGMARQDAKMMAKNYKKLAIDYEIEDERAFEMELQDLIDDYTSLDISEVNMAELIQSLQDIIRHNRMRMPGGVFIIMRALGILEGIGKTIYPEFKTYEFFKPYGFTLLKQIYSPENIIEEGWHLMSTFTDFVTSFPVEVRGIIEKTNKGSLRLEMMNLMDEVVVDKLNKAINRLVIAIVILGLYTSSGIITLAYSIYQGEYSWIILVLGIAGFVSAISLTFALLFSAWWSTR
ncbi:MAG: ABC1 kinase family protein, partial [Saprospiraceae bacterium]